MTVSVFTHTLWAFLYALGTCTRTRGFGAVRCALPRGSFHVARARLARTLSCGAYAAESKRVCAARHVRCVARDACGDLCVSKLDGHDEDFLIDERVEDDRRPLQLDDRFRGRR